MQGITLHKGIAGQLCVTATVDHGDTVSFYGSVYGGPVVMVTPSGLESFVTDPGRFGAFADDPKEWAHKFVTANA